MVYVGNCACQNTYSCLPELEFIGHTIALIFLTFTQLMYNHMTLRLNRQMNFPKCVFLECDFHCVFPDKCSTAYQLGVLIILHLAWKTSSVCDVTKSEWELVWYLLLEMCSHLLSCKMSDCNEQRTHGPLSLGISVRQPPQSGNQP